MVTAVRPVFQKQGPATNCVIEGEALGWKSCTAYAMAMGIDSATGGDKQPNGCLIRSLTGDTVAGLMLRQVAEVAYRKFDVRVTVKTGADTISPESALRQIRVGRGFVLQGNSGGLPMHLRAGGPKAVQHAVWVNEVKGGDDNGTPARALVYDPAADRRRPDIVQGPMWWTWDQVLSFAAALKIDETHSLGPGKFYAGFIPARDVEHQAPHVDLANVTFRNGATKTDPFPDRVRTNRPGGRKINIRRRPDRINPADIVERVRDGTLFIAYQKIKGAPVEGSRIWYGNRRGTEWIPKARLRKIGGPG